MKRSFFQAVVVSILLFGCTTWTLTKCMEKKLDANYTRMLWVILNKYPTKQQLHGPPTTHHKNYPSMTNQTCGHCCWSRDELIGNVVQRNPWHGRAKAGRPAQTYMQQLSDDTGCSPEDLPDAINVREEWREGVRDIRAISVTWYIYICVCVCVYL